MTTNLDIRINEIMKAYPDITKELKQELDLQPDLCCLWHRKNHPGHKGNFGLMGECLDCMEDIKKGRCSVDVKNFDFDLYWTVRNFWLKVDIRDPSECWHWTGATKKKNTETVAYMPSPFHSGKTQSAARVAFWTSRGYTGRYRVKHRKGCDMLCCNPLHLSLSELVSLPEPKEIETIQLNYGHLKNLSKTRVSDK